MVPGGFGLWLGLGLLVSACGGKAEPPAEKTYTLYYNAQKEPEGGVPAKLTVPAAWKEELDAMGSPSFRVPDIDSPLPSLGIVAIRCPAEGDCMDYAINLQFGEERAGAQRDDLGPGRVFVTLDGVKGSRQRTHARLFALATAQKGVVMCNIMMMDASAKLPELRKVCESLKL